LLSASYVLFATLTHFISIHFLPLLLLSLVHRIAGMKKFLILLAIIYASTINTLIVMDANFFAVNRFHMSLMTAILFDSETYLFSILQFIIMVVFHYFLGNEIGKSLERRRNKSFIGVSLAVATMSAWIYVQGVHIWADASYQSSITTFTRYLPLFRPIHAKRDLARLGLIDSDQLRKQNLSKKTMDSELLYPKNELLCRSDTQSENVLVILIDALRPEMINGEIMPNTAKLFSESISFDNHYSGGTSSRMGMFSLFYGLPSTYWRVFHDNLKPALMITKFDESNYDIHAISSSGLGSPAVLDRTAFAGISSINLRPLGASEKASLKLVTNGWVETIKQNQDPKFFTLLHYDPPIDEANPSESLNIANKFSRKNDTSHNLEVSRYIQSIRDVDMEIGRLSNVLRERDMLKDTIVILTSDHGYELDDYQTNYYGHSSNYSPAQTKVPLKIIWPNRDSQKYSFRSSHHDFAPTLLKEVLGCTNSYSDYSTGNNLFQQKPWKYLIAGSYDSFAVLTPEKVIISYGSYFEVRDKNYNLSEIEGKDLKDMEDAISNMSEYYK
tara:strand:- start:42735 stop:44405 length:1671 start_codon:yes stop_codon:yes gene_type:complete